MTQHTITINGTVYDSLTGLPVTQNTITSATTPVNVARRTPIVPKPSLSAHQAAQKSLTLNRHAVTKKPAHTVVTKQHTTTHRPDIIRSSNIKKFAPHPVGAKQPAAPSHEPRSTAHTQAVIATPHPVAARAIARQQQSQSVHRTSHTPATIKPSQTIKNEAIAAALAKEPVTKPHDQIKSQRQMPRQLSIVSAGFALILLGGYFTYINMPNLSVRVAAAQAGIAATYPSYHPDGYRLNGPVAYTDGEVNMKFASNSGPQNYMISQKKSNWDSSAVEQDINQKTSGSYTTSTVSGLTIYLYGNNASWVNGGILYSLAGDAPLSSDQIDHIATSM
jgi:hypothetical protein